MEKKIKSLSPETDLERAISKYTEGITETINFIELQYGGYGYFPTEGIEAG